MSNVTHPNRVKSKKVEMILQQLHSLPTLPSVATRLLQITVQSHTQADEVVQLIQSDPSLSAKIIRLTNQASKDVNRQTVSSISKAVVLLGFETLRNAVLSIKVFETLGKPGDQDQQGFDRSEFWKHCLAVGCATSKFMPHLDNKVDPEEAFLCGLLHDLGKVALDSCLPKSIARIVQITESTLSNIADVEKKVLGIDHTTAGKRLAQRWGLPQSIVECVWLHHQHPATLPDSLSHPGFVRAVYLADLLAREQRIGYSGNHVFQESSVAVGEALGISKEVLERTARELRQEVVDRAFILGLDDLNPDEMFQEALADANGELGRLNGQLHTQNRKLQIRSKYFDLLSALGQKLHPQQTVVDVTATIAGLWRQHIVCPYCAVYALSQENKVIEGAASLESETEPLAFLIEQDNWDTDKQSQGSTEFKQAVFEIKPVGDTHSWFFEQVTELFDVGLTYWMPLFIGESLVGGLLWQQAERHEWYADQLSELQAFATCAAMALSQVQTLDAQNNLCEELVGINRLLTDTRGELVKKKSLATVGEMASGAAHEINNPLAIIVGRAQLLASSENDPKRKETLEAIAEQGQEITGIIKELMYFAKPTQPQPHVVGLRTMVDQVLEKAAPLARANNIAMDVHVAEDISDVFVDEAQIVQALSELLINAVDAYESAEGTVTIKGACDDLSQEVTIDIIDQGQGMDSVTLEKAFTPFYSSKQAGRKRGLGLSRCLRAIESNGGHLRLISEPGHGTTARIGLPISQLTPANGVTV